MEKSINELIEFCIINVDKPAGITSFKCAEKVGRILGAKKAGHFGTLDPMVTGVLPVALNRACKLSNYFMKKDKEYIGKMLLHRDISEQRLRDEMEGFIGRIMQKPPVKSRVKRVLRERIVNKFKIIKKDGRIVEFESDVQAGTYIRKLISDLGEKIGGAHMTELRRTRAGIFNINDSNKIEIIEQAIKKLKENKTELELRKILIPAEVIQRILTRTDVKDESLKGLLNGKPLMKNDLLKEKVPNSELFVVFCKEKFVGVYKRLEEGDIIARPEFVMN
jgi:H/ACA ribonucleoprotein complex subunit 4